MDKLGICLPGGGAAGVNQAAALRVLYKLYGADVFKFTTISSTSVGSLNGVLFCQSDFDALEEIWNGLTRRKIFTCFNTFTPFSNSFLSTRPLENLIEEYIDHKALQNSPTTIILNAVDGDTGDRVWGLGSDSDVLEGLLAGSAIPILFPPRQYKGHWCVDGGIYDNSPISPLINIEVNKILIIHAQPKKVTIEGFEKDSKFKQISNTISLLFKANQNKDIERINYINGLLESNILTSENSKYRHIDIFEWFPEYNISTLDFNNKRIKEAWRNSYEKAEDIFSSDDFCNMFGL